MILNASLRAMTLLSMEHGGSLASGLLVRCHAPYQEAHAWVADPFRIESLRQSIEGKEEHDALETLSAEPSRPAPLVSRGIANALIHLVDVVQSSIPQTSAIPAGRHIIGNLDNARWTDFSSFNLALYPVTYGQFLSLAMTCGLMIRPRSSEMRDDAYPAVNVTLHTAKEYAAWLSVLTGRGYRLPTDAEWERAARGDPVNLQPPSQGWLARYENGFWAVGGRILHDPAVIEHLLKQGVSVSAYHVYGTNDGSLTTKNAHWGYMQPMTMGQHPGNPFGLGDMTGNIMELTLSESGTPVLCGGYHCMLDPVELKITQRIPLYEPYSPYFGFRLLREQSVRPPDQPDSEAAYREIIDGSRRPSSLR